ncbi:MAG: M23 family metallopeptidase [Clostridia bacterium]|nr:M23 family metallopeptidase [Clostridia bacterium]
MENKKNNKTNIKFKVAYAFAVVIALGTVVFAKISTERNLGNIKSLEEQPVTITTTESTTILIEETVRQNLENVPDTREETEKITTEDKYNTPYKDYYCLPFGNKIVKDFNKNTLVYSETMGDWRTHQGIDFAGEEGTAVVAISYGEVISIYDDALFGTCVLIDHGNGVTAKYCGLNKDTLNVEEHSIVNIESVIGHSDFVPSEKSEGSHIHFEITYNGEIVEPLELMGK